MNALERLRGGLVVSVQAEEGSLLGSPGTIALLAQVAVRNGAAGVRIAGAECIRAVREVVDVPIVGIVKRAYSGFEPYITTTLDEVAVVAQAGAEIVAFDATARARAGGAAVADLAHAAHDLGILAMGDCATAADGRAATAAGIDMLATTLAGYTLETAGRVLPALDLVQALAALHPFVVCEGGIASPEHAAAAFAAGASAIVVGTAITNVDALTRKFAAAAPAAERAE